MRKPAMLLGFMTLPIALGAGDGLLALIILLFVGVGVAIN